MAGQSAEGGGAWGEAREGQPQGDIREERESRATEKGEVTLYLYQKARWGGWARAPRGVSTSAGLSVFGQVWTCAGERQRRGERGSQRGPACPAPSSADSACSSTSGLCTAPIMGRAQLETWTPPANRQGSSREPHQAHSCRSLKDPLARAGRGSGLRFPHAQGLSLPPLAQQHPRLLPLPYCAGEEGVERVQPVVHVFVVDGLKQDAAVPGAHRKGVGGLEPKRGSFQSLGPEAILQGRSWRQVGLAPCPFPAPCQGLDETGAGVTPAGKAWPHGCRMLIPASAGSHPESPSP